MFAAMMSRVQVKIGPDRMPASGARRMVSCPVSVCRGMRTAGRASIGSNSGIGDNFQWGGRNLGRGNRCADRDRAHEQRCEGGDQLTFKFKAGHGQSPFYGPLSIVAGPAPLYKSRANCRFLRKILIELGQG